MALFGRRKSVVQVEVVPDEQEKEKEKEKETRRRNRLSKPLTSSKISTSVSTTSLQEPVPRSQNLSSAELVPGGPLSSHPSNPVLRHQIRNEVFDSDRLSPKDALKSSSTLSVAQMVSQIDQDVLTTEGSQAPSVSPSKPKKRKSLILRRLSAHNSTNLTRTASKERLGSLRDDPAGSSPSSSLDRMVDAPPIPPTRRASFTPGAATRKPSRIPSKDVLEKNEEIIEEVEERSIVGPDYFEWQPQPPAMAGRVGTPADLSYSHLAGFRIGSLQVTNGRASPAFSEMSKASKHLLAVPKQHRDVSSEYGECDDEVRDSNVVKEDPALQYTPGAASVHRSFSWESKNKTVEEEMPCVPDEFDARTKIPLDMDDDQASLMAKEYMAELPASPFSLMRSGSLAGSVRRIRSDGSLQKTPSLPSLQRSPSPDFVEARDSSPVTSLGRSFSNSGSVIRKSSLKLRVIVSNAGRRATGEDGQSRDSLMSWYSPIDLSFDQDEAFESALEFQVQKSPTRPQPQPSLDKSDSGYSSTKSLRSLHKAKPMPTVVSSALKSLPILSLNSRPQQLQTMSSDLRQRPSILKTRKTEPNVPTFANLRPAVISLNSAPTVPSPVKTPTKPVKSRKKLQKKRTQSQPPGKIAVTRVRSFEADSIPAIPTNVQENLRIRTEELPELEQTYTRLNNQASLSTIDLHITEIRFPSPGPQQSVQMQRSRSRSRPRSWISRSKENASRSRRDSDLSQADALAIINDFGTFASSLGSSPYDLAHENIESNRTRSAYRTSTVVPGAKSMMDDKTAAEVARVRRRSFQQRDAHFERRASFNDRGGIPGKSLRPASFVSEAPPITQEMLQTVYRTSSLQRQTSLISSPAPPPPPHSPRPAYVNYHEDRSDLAVAQPPPPPSHSPCPVNIMPDSWAAQAAAWKARRRSLGVALNKQARESHRSEEVGQYPEEPLYPVIPPRNQQEQIQWTQYTASPEEYFPSHTERRDDYDPYSQTYHPNYEQPRGRYHQMDENEYACQDLGQYSTHNDQSSRGSPIGLQGSTQRRPLPQPKAIQYKSSSRAHSQAASVRSHTSSLAEELHPPELPRPHIPPEFGRYSGGMDYGYERGNGFGGSTGTRSTSGKAEASRKGVPLRAGYGIDLGDVPVLSMVRV